MRRFFKQLFCWHLSWSPFGYHSVWEKGLDIPRSFVCRHCGKVRHYIHQPINYFNPNDPDYNRLDYD